MKICQKHSLAAANPIEKQDLQAFRRPLIDGLLFPLSLFFIKFRRSFYAIYKIDRRSSVLYLNILNYQYINYFICLLVFTNYFVYCLCHFLIIKDKKIVLIL
ncbi:hypothetical protein NIASO_13080 [Niabella soli DSM 19437]|uniref:Uncharacterized protein n=1 Tax=Niabella soli DSM 19437 TaxID=929713 RepID=W0F7E8_9BACT|nr:hypothetical protein NIASO_13080 [Niabella soli DSM 19437]